ncbi:MAG TPA: tripartite tricarboxylate transporter substrate-binding protein, partial [Candidatus Binatus sp.]|nr:tripartite tricarboxylate transporter substrate-binding protein [Candidatus Binatus sp.]
MIVTLQTLPHGDREKVQMDIECTPGEVVDLVKKVWLIEALMYYQIKNPFKRSQVQNFKLLGPLIFFVLGLLNPFNLEPAFAQANFYKDKTVRIVIGFTPGGFYDRWARLLSRYMPKYVPGNPNFLVQNMPGASSVIAANYVYNLSKADGLTLLMPINSLYLDQVVGRGEVKFDVRKFEFIGTQEKTPTLLYFRSDSPFKTLNDIINAKEPPKCGSTGTASTGYLLAKIMDEAFKAKMNTVSGYQGGSEIDIAVERGEIVCRGMDIPPHFGREPFDSWHKKGFDRHILQSGPKRDPRMGDAPTLFELMDQFKTPEVVRRTARIIMASGEFGRPMLAGPGNPPERIKIMRDAYAKAMHDFGLVDEAKKGQMDLEYT